MDEIHVVYRGMPVGNVKLNKSGLPVFGYYSDFVDTGIELSPLMMPLEKGKPYRFSLPSPEGYEDRDTFKGLPGMLADPLPEKFGNSLLSAMLSRQGRRLSDLTAIERLAYLGRRGMGALEFFPEMKSGLYHDSSKAIDVPELVEVARKVLSQKESVITSLSEDQVETIISVGTSAGGAKAKAVIAWNPDTNEVRSGEGDAPEGFEHWLIKFDDFENEEHAVAKEQGAMEYAYYLMSTEADLGMMPSRLFKADGLSHFMTRRYDRLPDTGEKLHVQSLCALAHLDRNPPGQHDYASLFMVARQLGCGQDDLDLLFKRMAFNVVTRNQDDHTKNHAFILDPAGGWFPAPVYDVCFSYKPGHEYIGNHQMSVNGKRNDFTIEDLVTAAKMADIKRYKPLIEEVVEAARSFPEKAAEAGLSDKKADYIFDQFRFKDEALTPKLRKQ